MMIMMMTITTTMMLMINYDGKDDDDHNYDDDDGFNGNKSVPADVEVKLVMMKISLKVTNVRRESYLL